MTNKIKKAFPKNKIVAIPLRYVPFYSIFRFKKEWWYYIPCLEFGDDNAVTVEGATTCKTTTLSLETVVGADINSISKSRIKFAKMIY